MTRKARICTKLGVTQASRLAVLLSDYGLTLRNNSELAKSILWDNVLKGKPHGHKFKKNFFEGGHRVDFICLRKHLIIETDVELYDNIVLYEYHDQRTFELQELGFKILRFSNEVIIEELEGVIIEIMTFLEKI